MTTSTKKRPTVAPSFKPTSREELEAKRRGHYEAIGPSGAGYLVRKVNLRRHAFAGGLPGELLEFALSGGGRQTLRDMADGDTARLKAYQDYLDRLVCATIIMEPPLTPADLHGSDELEDDPLVPVVDQEWAQDLAFGRTEDDALGRRIWGPEPLSTFDYVEDFFGKAHRCPEGCQDCAEAKGTMQRLFTAMRLGEE
jgi:hypothetical protein